MNERNKGVAGTESDKKTEQRFDQARREGAGEAGEANSKARPTDDRHDMEKASGGTEHPAGGIDESR